MPGRETHLGALCAVPGCSERIPAPDSGSDYCVTHGLLVWNFARWLYGQGVPVGFEGHWLYRGIASSFDADRAYLGRGWQPEQPRPMR